MGAALPQITSHNSDTRSLKYFGKLCFFHIYANSCNKKIFLKRLLQIYTKLGVLFYLVESNGSPEETVPLDFPCWICTEQHSDVETWRDHITAAHKLPLIFR